MSGNQPTFTRSITRRTFLYSSTAAVAGLSAPGSLSASAHNKAPRDTDYSPVIEKIKQQLPFAMRLKDITGPSIALIDGENTVWSEGFGYTDRSQRVRVSRGTLFHAGSISKSFTALGVLRAVEKGLLALDDPVKKHLPWFSVNKHRCDLRSVGRQALVRSGRERALAPASATMGVKL
jgi:CubicO group peptidase (beta-lactamase class C family)